MVKKFLTIICLCLIFISILVITLFFENSRNNDFSSKDLYKLELVDGKVKCVNNDYVVCLTKEEDKDFKIVNFADIQLSSSETIEGNEVYDSAKSSIEYVINETSPDLITLTGDQGYGEKKSITAIGNILDKYNIPWAVTFGNHDNECDWLTLQEQIELYNTFNNCIIKEGPNKIGVNKNGNNLYGCYIINIVEIENNTFKVIRSLFMLNSGDNMEYDLENKQLLNGASYAHLSDKQVEFYKWGIRSANIYSESTVKSTLIQHIPLTAYNFAYAEAFNTNRSVYDYKKILYESLYVSLEDSYKESNWKEGYKESFGVSHEYIMGAPIDDHVFERMLEMNSLDSVIVGHDHNNNWVVKYQGVYLAYALKTGKGCYYEDGLDGGTLLTVTSSSIKIEHIYNNKDA